MRFIIVIFLCLGLSSDVYGKSVRIIGGSTAYISDFPYIVSIRNVNSNHFYCAGSIVSHVNIITSAHCLYHFNNNFDELRIFAGNKYIDNMSGSSFEIEKVHFHPDFRKSITTLLMNRFDVCVVKINKRIEFNEYQQKINLPTKNIFTGNLAVIAGWGRTSYPNGHLSNKLQSAPMLISSNVDCLNGMPIVIYSDQFCTFNSHGVGSCTGDSGGPVVKDGKLVGIISLSYGCAMGLPDISTNVYMFLSFIEKHLEAK